MQTLATDIVSQHIRELHSEAEAARLARRAGVRHRFPGW